MGEAWIDGARRRLIASADGGAWGYRRGGPTSAEATALAALGLLATDPDGGATSRTIAARAADRLAGLQARDGSVGATSQAEMPGWGTPFALLLWRALDAHPGPRRLAADWLLGERVATSSRSDDPGRVVGHDTTIAGWPWVAGTHAWVEPTALAVLALGPEVGEDHPRVLDGLRLLRDRAIATGGWNFGNSAVFGRALRPQPGPTGLALLALARGRAVGGVVERGTAYLVEALPDVRACQSLGWGLLGLRAWGRSPEGRDGWLAEASGEAIRRDDAAVRLAVLLLAAAPATPALLGLDLATDRTHR